jgi:hypothetical protein
MKLTSRHASQIEQLAERMSRPEQLRQAAYCEHQVEQLALAPNDRFAGSIRAWQYMAKVLRGEETK